MALNKVKKTLAKTQIEKKADQDCKRGQKLDEDGEYAKAEVLFRRATNTYEETLGTEHAKTLEAKQLLGQSLYE